MVNGGVKKKQKENSCQREESSKYWDGQRCEIEAEIGSTKKSSGDKRRDEQEINKEKALATITKTKEKEEEMRSKRGRHEEDRG